VTPNLPKFGFNFSSVVNINFTVFRDVPSCSEVDRYQRFGSTFCLRLRSFLFFYQEDGGTKFFRNAGKYLPNFKQGHPSRVLSVMTKVPELSFRLKPTCCTKTSPTLTAGTSPRSSPTYTLTFGLLSTILTGRQRAFCVDESR
jgi:hypothetical protein